MASEGMDAPEGEYPFSSFYNGGSHVGWTPTLYVGLWSLKDGQMARADRARERLIERMRYLI